LLLLRHAQTTRFNVKRYSEDSQLNKRVCLSKDTQVGPLIDGKRTCKHRPGKSFPVGCTSYGRTHMVVKK